ncbi:hypothetical protein EV702DRAFT_1042487 [Suillus placidus]|uniref:Uncharacterized protein n=1 Tax=Suillus placidus TaxID=48579 RepID=A0A9P7A2U3_9AGAM|nr:hypothetical protein EV702DRAFT_1042487 [Suillus placidus]
MLVHMLGRGALSFAAAVAPTAHAAKVAKACESTIESTKHVVASTAGGDMDESSSEAVVKIVGERTTEEKVICGSRVVPPHPVKPLPVHAPPAPLSKGKGKAVESDETLQLVLVENADLKEEMMCLRVVLASVHQYARAEQAEMISVSNKAYGMAQNWALVEVELAEVLE